MPVFHCQSGYGRSPNFPLDSSVVCRVYSHQSGDYEMNDHMTRLNYSLLLSVVLVALIIITGL